MIKAIANQRLDLSSEEYEYYLELEKAFGKESFLGLFRTNEAGQITSVLPPVNNPTAMILIFFFMNVMFNQRLRKLDGWMNKVEDLERRIQKLEDKDE